MCLKNSKKSMSEVKQYGGSADPISRNIASNKRHVARLEIRPLYW